MKLKTFFAGLLALLFVGLFEARVFGQNSTAADPPKIEAKSLIAPKTSSPSGLEKARENFQIPDDEAGPSDVLPTVDQVVEEELPASEEEIRAWFDAKTVLFSTLLGVLVGYLSRWVPFLANGEVQDRVILSQIIATVLVLIFGVFKFGPGDFLPFAFNVFVGLLNSGAAYSHFFKRILGRTKVPANALL